ncbi:MAG: hypothetical protein U0231_10495 [Nitrospiraceae bacterium]
MAVGQVLGEAAFYGPQGLPFRSVKGLDRLEQVVVVIEQFQFDRSREG